MIPELLNRWERLDIKSERAARETAEYIALSILISNWIPTNQSPFSNGGVQRRMVKEWADIAYNIIIHGSMTPTPPQVAVSVEEEDMP